MKLIAYNERGWRIGEDHPRAKYTDHEVSQVLALRGAGLTYREISERLEIPWTTIRAMCSGAIRAEQPAHYRRSITPPHTPRNKGRNGD